jgi:hypothetical protein
MRCMFTSPCFAIRSGAGSALLDNDHPTRREMSAMVVRVWPIVVVLIVEREQGILGL